MIQKRLVGLFLIILAMLGIAPGQIQPAHAAFATPLVLLMKGDLWTWTPTDSTLTQLTHHGYNYRPVLSPDGTRVAYKSLADITISTATTDEAKSLMQVNGPANIWVWDLTTGQAKRIGDQPSNVSNDPSSGGWENALVRSAPAWSPDGSKVTWVEMTLPGYRFRLVVYDFASDSTAVIVPQLPAPYLDGPELAMIEPQWGTGGIAMLVQRAGKGVMINDVRLFDAQGTELLSYQQENPIYAMLWVEDSGKNYIGLQQDEGKWALIDPETKQATTIGLVSLELRSISAGDSATYSVVYRFVDISHGDWKIADRTGIETPLNKTGPVWDFQDLALDPSGQMAAYSTTGFYVWQNGAAKQIPGTESFDPNSFWFDDGALVWGPVTWHLRPLGAG